MQRVSLPTASARRTGDDALWAERYALGVFILFTPISFMMCSSGADGTATIVIANTLAALGAWGIFRAVDRARLRRALATVGRANRPR
jgi:hypothetical protein